LRIGLRCPAGHEVEQQEHQKATEEAVEQVERGGAQTHREEEELSLSPENREWPG
jgi:hypothetical protein